MKKNKAHERHGYLSREARVYSCTQDQKTGDGDDDMGNALEIKCNQFWESACHPRSHSVNVALAVTADELKPKSLTLPDPRSG
jgi:hypothetical protein